MRRKKSGEVRERTNINAEHYMILSGPNTFSSTCQCTERRRGVVSEVKEMKEMKETEISGKEEKSNTSGQGSNKARRAAQKVARHSDLWKLAHVALEEIDSSFASRVHVQLISCNSNCIY